MITTVSSLLEALKEKEISKISKFGEIKHAPTIGSFYEKLSQNLLSASIFQGLNLRVVSGFIINPDGSLSGQIDCMLVVDEGDLLPNGSDYIYPRSQVVAVFEIKKNLFTKDVSKAYLLLTSVIDLKTGFKLPEEREKIVYDSCRQAFGKSIESKQVYDSLDSTQQMMFEIFRKEAELPLRIVWGYNGFKSELTLRDSFYKYLCEAGTKEAKPLLRYSPLHFPNLVMCGELSLVKINGMPYGSPYDSSYGWDFYASAASAPMLYMLEIIWTRLDYLFKLPKSIFLGSTEIDPLQFFLSGMFIESTDGHKWCYSYNRLDENGLKYGREAPKKF